MIAKMRRQGQYFIVFYFMFFYFCWTLGHSEILHVFFASKLLAWVFITEMMGKGMRSLCNTSGRALQEASDGCNRALE